MAHLVVSYDVVEDYKRAKLARFLKGFFDHVQKSVFEGPVDEARLQDLRLGIARRIDRGTDSVRVYHLCARCREATEIVGSGVYVDTDPGDVLV